MAEDCQESRLLKMGIIFAVASQFVSLRVTLSYSEREYPTFKTQDAQLNMILRYTT